MPINNIPPTHNEDGEYTAGLPAATKAIYHYRIVNGGYQGLLIVKRGKAIIYTKLAREVRQDKETAKDDCRFLN